MLLLTRSTLWMRQSQRNCLQGLPIRGRRCRRLRNLLSLWGRRFRRRSTREERVISGSQEARKYFQAPILAVRQLSTRRRKYVTVPLSGEVRSSERARLSAIPPSLRMWCSSIRCRCPITIMWVTAFSGLRHIWEPVPSPQM